MKRPDFCGPAQNAIISRLVPDEVQGVDFRGCCKCHDDAYQAGGSAWARLRADIALARCIRCKLSAAGHNVTSWAAAAVYFAGVRLGGWACWSWRLPSLNPFK